MIGRHGGGEEDLPLVCLPRKLKKNIRSNNRIYTQRGKRNAKETIPNLFDNYGAD